jgi:LmbE family N-acetylglucosaminyl deacetylase
MPLSRRALLAAAAAPFLPASLKIVVAGGHPGDPECGCAGAVARYTQAGHDAVLLYLNRGEGYCGGAALDRCAGIRTAEAGKACGILKARAVFADQYDGRAIVDAAHYEAFAKLLAAERPDIVFTQWPIDEHRDHRAVSLLTLDAWMKGGRQFALYYYEVAEDTMSFSPTEYVDISSVERCVTRPVMRMRRNSPGNGIRNRWRSHAHEGLPQVSRRPKVSGVTRKVSAAGCLNL